MSEKPVSAEYSRFLASVAGAHPDYRESLDEAALLALEGDERKAAEDLLIERVRTTNDWRVPPALTALNLKRAVKPMQERLPESKGRMKLALARALVKLGALDRLDETVIEMLEAGDLDEGTSALAAATNLTSKELMVTLAWASLHHPAPEIRIGSGAKLLYVSKHSGDPLAWKYRPLYLVLGEEDEKTRREAYEEICKLTGVPPEVADEKEGAHVSP